VVPQLFNRPYILSYSQLADIPDRRPDSSLPEGSTLGPLLYLTFASELQEVAERHSVAFHSFANDIQLSKSARIEDVYTAKQAVIYCVFDIEQWNSSHRLQMNANKSEVIWLCMRQQLTMLSQADMILRLNDSVLVLQPSAVVRNLGV